MLADCDVGVLLDAPSYRQLDQRSGHRVCDKPEIAVGKRIKTRSFEAKVETHAKRHRSAVRKVLPKAGKEIVECVLATAEETMRMPCLRCPGPVRGVEWEAVAFQHDDIFEVVGKSTRCRQTGHTGADYNSAPAGRCRPHQSLR